VDDLEVEEDKRSSGYRDLLSDDDGSIASRRWEQAAHLILEHSDRSHSLFSEFVSCCFVPCRLLLAAPSNAAMPLLSPLPQSLVGGRDM
jgi:hypothetical protein